MDITGWAALLTAVSGVVVAASSMAGGLAVESRIERLSKLRSALPADSLARKSVDEAIDWLALRVVERARKRSVFIFKIVGFLLYLGGTFVVFSQMLAFIQKQKLEMGGLNFGWLVLGFGGMIGGMMFLALAMSDRRESQLAKLKDLESKELIARHARHQIRQSRVKRLATLRKLKRRVRKRRAATAQSST